MLIFYGIVIFTKLFHTEKNKYSILKKLLYLFFFFNNFFCTWWNNGISKLSRSYHKDEHLYNEWWYGLIMSLISVTFSLHPL